MKKPKYKELLVEVENDDKFLNLSSKENLSDDEIVELITYPSNYLNKLNRYLIEREARRLVGYYKHKLNVVLSFNEALKMVENRVGV